jgi:asparagine synthase (glutamine-hydrolysing)
VCGICGAVQLGGEPRFALPTETLARMTDAMSHRGPDDRGLVEELGMSLGARRLSIVDVEGGHQPFANEDGTIWGAQNGELYNHESIRAELERDGHRFRSRCDTEILPHLYERDGDAFVERLRGKFAVAVWDGRRRRAVLARDRLGIKPLYWARRGDLLLFASELKSLLASGLIEPRLDYEALDAYLTFGFVPGPRTPLANVWKLDPGCRLVVDEGGNRVERYWSYPLPEPDRSLSEREHAERLLALLEESVRLRLMSDVPLGAMLSGGLDSSLIVALMARNMRDPVQTFSVGFAEGGNELADAREVAALVGADHHELELSFAHDTVDLADLVWHLDEPLADLSALGFLALSQLARRHVTVALSGQGADELLGGYRNHRAAAVASEWLRLPEPLRRAGLRLGQHGPAGVRRAAHTLSLPDTLSRAVAGRLDPALRARLVRGPLAELDGSAARRVVLSRLREIDDDPLQETLYLDAQLGLVDDMLHYFDRASMAHSLEVRVPFLDHELVEHCATIPPELKVRRLETKHLLKVSARGLVPDRIIDKPKVGFFNAAVDAWFSSQLERASDDYLSGTSQLLDPAAVRELVAGHRRGGGNGQVLLRVLMLEVWLQSFLPRAMAAPVEVAAA